MGAAGIRLGVHAVFESRERIVRENYIAGVARMEAVRGIVLGLILYLWPVIYLACTVVRCEVTHKDKITFSRVSSAFARAVRQKQPAAAKL